MRVQLVAKPSSSVTGTSRYAENVRRGLEAAGVQVTVTAPEPFPPAPIRQIARQFGLDAAAFFRSYPLRVKQTEADVIHLTTQTMGTLLLTQRFTQPVVVTILDILPYLLRHDPQLNTLRHPLDALFYRLALLGLKRANALIAISQYTKRTLVEALHIPPEKIHVVYPAIDLERFRPQPVPDSFYTRYGLRRDGCYVLYVGSDDPRKNLPTLVRALARLRQTLPEVQLLKVGAPHFTDQRRELMRLIEQLQLQSAVHFFDEVRDDDLPSFYNAASVLAMPSLYEGFGYPVVEAMACGTPVVAARAASLAEIVGDLETTVWPATHEAMTQAMVAALNYEIKERTSRPAVKWARAFQLESAPHQVADVYRLQIEGGALCVSHS